jgi:adenylate cyclase
MGSWRRLRRTRAALILALIPGAIGIALSYWAPGISLEKAGGLDRLFALRGPRSAPPEVCVVAIDTISYNIVGRDSAQSWERGRHAELIQTLKREGAKAVAFDVLFLEAGTDPAQDAAFEKAIKDSGIVVLGSTVEITDDPLFHQAQIEEPYEPFAKAAAAVGDVNIPTDSDGVIRFAWPAREGRPGLGLAAYELATNDRCEPRMHASSTTTGPRVRSRRSRFIKRSIRSNTCRRGSSRTRSCSSGGRWMPSQGSP